jgi:hypothetical protein
VWLRVPEERNDCDWFRCRLGDLGYLAPLRHRQCNAMLHHAVDFTPYQGKEIRAWPAYTFLKGEVVWDGQSILGRVGQGEFLPCGRSEMPKPKPWANKVRDWIGMA